jgi:hypothetical protein
MSELPRCERVAGYSNFFERVVSIYQISTFDPLFATFAVEPMEDDDILGSFPLAELVIFESFFAAMPLPFKRKKISARIVNHTGKHCTKKSKNYTISMGSPLIMPDCCMLVFISDIVYTRRI